MLIQLAIMGVLVALLPLSIVWASGDKNKYRKLIWVTVFLTFDLIMFGAFTRLTDSGLGCPDWPGCYGHSNPFEAHGYISAAEAAMPTGPVTVVKAWIEMIHRYVAMGVGVLIVAIMTIAWKRRIGARDTDPKLSPWLPTVIFGFVCLQGAFGAWTVTLKLQPVIVTTHLLLGIGLLALLTWLGAKQNDYTPVAPQAQALHLPAAVALIILLLQIALGGWVSTNYAALACLDFPLCHGDVVPTMDFANGFTLWRHLGKTGEGDYLPFPALTAIHWVHRNFAIVVVLFIGWVAHKALSVEGLRKPARWLLIVIAMQFLTGMSTIFLKWPLILAVVHNGGAAALMLLLTVLNYRARIPAQGASNQAATQLSAA